MQIERVLSSRLGSYRLGSCFVSSLLEKLYVTAMSPANAQPIAPAGVGARATPAKVRKLAPMLIGFGSAANTEDVDSDSKSASTSFFMTSSLSKVCATARFVLPSGLRRRPTGVRAGRAALVRSGREFASAAYAAAYRWSKIEKEQPFARSEPLSGRPGNPDEPGVLHRGTRLGPAGFGAVFVYFFATWSLLVHNLGALDWLALLFSI